MLKIDGTEVEGHPWGELEKLDDLIYYDGPLLSLFRNGAGVEVLYLWVDVGEACNRWLVFSPGSASLAEYRESRMGLRELLLAGEERGVYAVDLDGEIRERRVLRFPKGGIPGQYLPEPDALLGEVA